MKTNSQTKFLSQNYSALHGLNAVSVGLGLFLASLWANVVKYPIKNFLLPIIIIIGTLLLSLVADQYYKRNFGVVKPASKTRRFNWIIQLVFGFLGLIAFWVDATNNLPICFIGLLFAGGFLFDKPMVRKPLNKFSAVRLVMAICIILVSTVPMLIEKDWWNILGVRSAIIGVTMFVGALIVMQGVLWHIFFIKSLPGQEAENE